MSQNICFQSFHEPKQIECNFLILPCLQVAKQLLSSGSFLFSNPRDWTVLGQCHHLVANVENHTRISASISFYTFVGSSPIYTVYPFLSVVTNSDSGHFMTHSIFNPFIHPLLVFSFVSFYLKLKKLSTSWLVQFLNNIVGLDACYKVPVNFSLTSSMWSVSQWVEFLSADLSFPSILHKEICISIVIQWILSTMWTWTKM